MLLAISCRLLSSSKVVVPCVSFQARRAHTAIKGSMSFTTSRNKVSRSGKEHAQMPLNRLESSGRKQTSVFSFSNSRQVIQSGPPAPSRIINSWKIAQMQDRFSFFPSPNALAKRNSPSSSETNFWSSCSSRYWAASSSWTFDTASPSVTCPKPSDTIMRRSISSV